MSVCTCVMHVGQDPRCMIHGDGTRLSQFQPKRSCEGATPLGRDGYKLVCPHEQCGLEITILDLKLYGKARDAFIAKCPLNQPRQVRTVGGKRW
jgi:hypothetical protein